MAGEVFQPPWSVESTAEVVVHLAPLLRPGAGEDDQRTSTRRAFELIAEYVSACRAEEGYCIALSDQEHLGCFLRAHSEERPFLRELAEAGRLDAFAGYYQLSLQTAHSETLLRNLALGLLAHDGSMGLKPVTYLLPDAARPCLQLPQLLARVGVEVVVWVTEGSQASRTGPARPGLPAFCHLMAPDGSTVMLKLQLGWSATEEGGCLPGDLNELITAAAESFSRQARLGLNHDLLLLGGAATSPPKWLSGRAAEMAQLTPSLVLSTPKRYLAAVKPEAQLRRASLPLLGEELGGAAALNPRNWELCQASHLAENAILSAERLATIAHFAGARYPQAALDKAWRQTLFAQGHAGKAGGTWCFDLLACYREAVELSTEVSNRSLTYLSGMVDTRRARRAPREGTAIIVFNTAGWERTDLCEASVTLEGPLASGFELVDDHGRKVPVECVGEPPAGENSETPRTLLRFVAANVPALGYRTWYLRPARAMPPIVTGQPVDSATIENEFLAVSAEAAAGGGLTSLRDKATGREFLDRERGLGVELVALAASGEVVPTERPERPFVWEGPVSCELSIGSVSSSGARVSQRVTLYHGLPRVDVRTSVSDPTGGGHALALRLPLSVPAETIVCGTPFGAVLRREHNAWLDSGGQPPGRGFWLARDWVDVGEVPSLLVMSGSERKRAVPLGPCAIITSSDLRQRAALRALEEALLSRGVPCAPYLDSDEMESQSTACALRITLGRENAYSQRLLGEHPRASAALASALRDDEWAGVLVHSGSGAIPTLIADTSSPKGVPRLIEVLAAAVASDRLAIPEECDFVGGAAQTPAGQASPPHNGSVALIGTGPLAVAGDRAQGLLVLLGAGGLLRAQHAIVPHGGDWREGDITRIAGGISNPLIAMQAPLQAGDLPPQFSLCFIDQPNLIITACKPARPKTEGAGQDRREVLIRMYESRGTPTSARVDFGASPQEAWLSDSLESRGAALTIAAPRGGLLRGGAQTPSVSVEVGANEIITLGVRLAPLAAAEGGQPDLGPAGEPGEVRFSRYWDHNAGAAPLGGQPLTLWMRGELPVGKNTRFSLGLSNDSDREISGRVEVMGPAEWTLIPRQVPYRIAAGSEAVYEIMIVVPPDASPCFLRATTRDGVHTIQEVLPVGGIRPLSAALTRNGDAFLVTVDNPNPDYVEGEVTIITPPETWPGGYAPGIVWGGLAVVEPRLQCFRIEAGSRQVFRFPIGGKGDGLEAVARVAWYGHVQYAYMAA